MPKVVTAVAGGGTPTEPAAGYNVYTPPSGFQQFDAGEPSIGVNWKTGSVFYQASLQTMRVKFDDTVTPARATWEDVSAPTSAKLLHPLAGFDRGNWCSPKTKNPGKPGVSCSFLL